jgi:adenylate cyclase class 2
MALEIEIKLKVDHLSAVRDRLKQLSAKRVREVMETNIFFDTPDHSLLGSDCGLRLRHIRDLADHQEKLVITYKGPRGEGQVKSREEIEVGVDSADNAVALLEKLGYVKMLTFEKRRESWKIEKCMIELDQLPHLGSFVEIECPTEAEVLKLRQKLGLAEVSPIAPTYADLVSHHLSDLGAREHVLKF